MANEPYRDRAFLYEMYVQRRMNLTDICKHLHKTYNIEITPQAIYNWVKKYDLLKFRGKGRKLSTGGQTRQKSQAQLNAESRKRDIAKMNKFKKQGRGR